MDSTIQHTKQNTEHKLKKINSNSNQMNVYLDGPYISEKAEDQSYNLLL